MPVSLPYLASNKNVAVFFDKIASAKVPEKFSHDFLQTTIGLKGSNDRQLIPLLRQMGFTDQSGTPKESYRLLKGDKRRVALADGIRQAYSPLFDADQEASKLSSDKLKSLISQVAGTDDDMTARIASTFATLAKSADFETKVSDSSDIPEKKDPKAEENGPDVSQDTKTRQKGLRPEFHYNIQVHLPANGTEEVYLNIFNALRKTFQ